MKKVLHLLHYPGEGGTEKYVYEIITNYGIDNCIFVTSKEGPLKTKLKALGVTCYHLPMVHPFDIRAALKLKQIIKKENISVVHTHFLRENYIAVLAKLLGTKIKVIWTYHVNVPMSKLNIFLNRIITCFNERVISVSKFSGKELAKKGVLKNKIEIIPNGVNIKHNKEIDSSNDDNKVITFATIGRLSKEKGQVFLVETLKELKNDPEVDFNWVCKLVGDGPLKTDLLSKVKEYGLEDKVVFCGFIPNIAEIMGHIDIVIIPSENDNFPFVAIEALAYGKPVIATNVGGIPEIVIHEKTGLLVEYQDKASLVRSIKRIVKDESLAKKFMVNNPIYYLEHFTFDKMFNCIVKIYNN